MRKTIPSILILGALAAGAATPSAIAEDIAITNPSFEQPAQADGDYTQDGSMIPGWVGIGIFPVANPRDDWFPGTTSGSTIPNPINGLNAGGLNTGGTIYQDLAATVQPGTGYTLSMLVGYRIGVPFGTLNVSLIAGGEVLMEAAATPPIEGTFAPYQFTYNSPSNGAFLGQPLRIKLTSSGASAQPWFDNIKLTTGAGSTNPPPPPPVVGIVVTNGSFETPALADGQYIVNGIPGWIGTGTYALANPNDSWFTGTTAGSALPNPIDGLNVGGLNSGATIYQELATPLESWPTYTLSMLVGRRSGIPFGTLTVSLMAGGQVLAQGVATAPGEGQFAPFELTYHSSASPFLVGHPLRIQLQSTGTDAQPWFDNITLSTNGTPPPPPPPPPPGSDIAILNSSFELPLQTDGAYVVNNIPSWSISGTVALSNPRDDWFRGTSTGSSIPNPVDGLNVAGINTGGEIYQDLSAVVQPGAAYTLSMLVGHRFGVPFGSLTVSLIADGQVLAQGLPPAPDNGSFAQFEFSYQAPADGLVIGKPLRVRLSCGGPDAQAWFDKIKLTVNGSPVPVITQQPVNVIAEAGAAVSFSVGASGGSPLGYQWYKGEAALEFGTTPTLNLPSIQTSDAGNYWAVVTNINGAVTSHVATLTITNITGVVVHPGFENLEGGGGSGVFRVPIRLQQVYSSTFFPQRPVSITEIRFRPSALYGKAFTNTLASFQLNLSTFSNPPPQLSLTFADNVGADDSVVFSGPLALSSAFSTVAGGTTKEFDIVVPLTTPFSYDASKGSLLLDVRNFTGGNVGNVDAGAKNDGKIKRVFAAGNVAAASGATDNGADVIEVRFSADPAAPDILVQPQGQSVLETETISLGVSATGDRPLSYQWYHGGAALVGAVTSGLIITNARPEDAGAYTVVVSNPMGSVTSVVANVSVNLSRTLSLIAPDELQEGTRISVSVQLASRGDVGGMTFRINYDTAYLKEASLVWDPAIEGLFNSVNYAPTGQIRATFALPATAVPEGNVSVATLNFLLRSVPTDLDSLVRVEILDASSPSGDPITTGNIARGGSVRIKKRIFTADNNANQRLDVGDATVMLRHLAGSEQTRAWDVVGNDLNGNLSIDSGDVIKVLRAAAGIDPQPGGEGGLLIAAAGSPNGTEALTLSPGSMKATAGSLVTFQIQLKDIRSAISGAAFTIEYPTNALRLENSQSIRSGVLIPGNALSIWNVAPSQNNFAIQSGKLTFVVSSANPWPSSNGTLAELTFRVQESAAAQYRWPLTLKNAEVTPDGFSNRLLADGSAVFIGRDPLPGGFSQTSVGEGGRFVFTAHGDAGAEYIIETSTDLGGWILFRRFTNTTGTVQIQGPELGQPQQFFRMRPASN